MKRLIVAICALVTMAVLPFGMHGVALADAGGNSVAAQACQHDGYASIVGGTPTAPVTFGNAGQCVSYGAQAGTLWQVSTATVTVQASNPNWTDTGVNLTDGEIATVAFTDNGATCDNTGSWDCTNHFAAYDDFLAPGLPAYALVGQVATGSPFEVTSGMTVSGPGEILVGFNDNVYSDNAGSYAVTIVTYTPLR